MAKWRVAHRRLSIYKIVILAVVMALIIKLFIADLLLIRGVSMSPTIRSGTVAIVLRCAYGIRLPFSGRYLKRWTEPSPGEVVLVAPTPGGPRQAVKRVFECGPAYMRAEAGILSARGVSIRIHPDASTRMAGQLYVPPGRVFIVGDNEEESFDSRDYGAVPVEKIAGKVLLFGGRIHGSVKKTVYSKDAADDVDR